MKNKHPMDMSPNNPARENKFHVGNGGDGKHYWLTPPELLRALKSEFQFDFDACPFPKPDDFDGLTCDWGMSSYANIPFEDPVILEHDSAKERPTGMGAKGHR